MIHEVAPYHIVFVADACPLAVVRDEQETRILDAAGGQHEHGGNERVARVVQAVDAQSLDLTAGRLFDEHASSRVGQYRHVARAPKVDEVLPQKWF